MSVRSELVRRNPLLAYAGGLNLAAGLFFLFLSAMDAREVLGLNVWIKPLKFSLSIALFLWTMAWLLAYLPQRRLVRSLSVGLVICMLVEQVCIIGQAARGTSSHFNIRTPFDGAIYATMGVFIVLNTVLVAVAAVAFFRNRFPTLPPAYVWGIRLGLMLFLLFSLEGAHMAGVLMRHTVGAPDGGPGLPLLNWSTRHGDLRVAHFVGLHALQVLPLVGYYLARTRLQMLLVGILYGAGALGLYLQALAGVPLLGVR
jgi:hypothetical protein